MFYTGPRHAIDKDSVCIEEDERLAHYLSNCKFDKENHHIDLPDKHDKDQGFKWIFYREEKESIFETSFNEECFTFIVSDQKKWDSDSLDKRTQEKVGMFNFVFLVIVEQFTRNLPCKNRTNYGKGLLLLFLQYLFMASLSVLVQFSF